jgi:hypothetical protein
LHNRVDPHGEAIYNSEDLDNVKQIGGIRIKYCLRSSPQYKNCDIDPAVLSKWGTVYEFRFVIREYETKKYYVNKTT